MANVITGTNADDFLLGNNENCIINGLDGNDEIIVFAGNHFISGGKGNDKINVGLGTHTIYGNEGDDFISTVPDDPGISLGQFYGGTGNDTYFCGVGIQVVEGLNEGIDTIILHLGGTPSDISISIPSNVENLIVEHLTNPAGFSIDGNSLNNIIQMLQGNVFAGAGDDILSGIASSANRFDGQGDFDTVTYASCDVAISVNLAGNVGSGGAAGDTIFNVERLIGSNFGDSLGGGIINSTIEGRAGNDTVDGGIGNNIINGGAGADNLVGREGNDTFLISGDEGLGDTMAGGIGTDTLRVLGSTDATLAGFSAADTSIESWLGNGKGVLGTAADDVFNFAALTAKTGLLFIDGAGGNDSITASNLADDLRGGFGNDTLNGGSGNDVIAGGLGNDVLRGGAGSDFFVFNTILNATTNRDSIADFVAINDTIRMENAIFTGLGAATGVLATAKFWASTTGLAHDADDRIIYNKTTGVLTYDNNGNAAGGAVAFATLATKPAITAADFVVI